MTISDKIYIKKIFKEIEKTLFWGRINPISFNTIKFDEYDILHLYNIQIDGDHHLKIKPNGSHKFNINNDYRISNYFNEHLKVYILAHSIKDYLK